MVDKPFATISYTEAVARLQASGQRFEYPVEWGTDLQSEHERYLTEVLFDRTPLMVTDYPKDIKAFYMRLNDDGKTVAAMDLLVPGVGELIGGSQREDRLEVLEARMAACGLEPADYWWCVGLLLCATDKQVVAAGIWICGGMGRCRMLALGWALSGWCCSPQGLTILGTPFHFLATPEIVIFSECSHPSS